MTSDQLLLKMLNHTTEKDWCESSSKILKQNKLERFFLDFFSGQHHVSKGRVFPSGIL